MRRINLPDDGVAIAMVDTDEEADQQQRTIDKRWAFVMKYMADRGWDECSVNDPWGQHLVVEHVDDVQDCEDRRRPDVFEESALMLEGDGADGDALTEAVKELRKERDELLRFKTAVLDAIGNGADENVWPSGLTVPEAISRLIAQRQHGSFCASLVSVDERKLPHACDCGYEETS